MDRDDGMEKGYVQVKVYAARKGEKLVELPEGATGIVDDEGVWIHGPLPLEWSKVMLKNTLAEWGKDAWTHFGAEFASAA